MLVLFSILFSLLFKFPVYIELFRQYAKNKGYFYFTNNDVIYVWEYEKKPAAKGSPESKVVTNLIYPVITITSSSIILLIILAIYFTLPAPHPEQ